jgi:hypothetical protein
MKILLQSRHTVCGHEGNRQTNYEEELEDQRFQKIALIKVCCEDQNQQLKQNQDNLNRFHY